MREYIIADNQDITKAGMMFLLSKQKDISRLSVADNKAELIRELRLYPQAVVILDYTLFDFAGAEELVVLRERFKEADWLLFSDELSMNFLRQVLFSSTAFGVVMKDNSKEEIITALQCASRKERYICNHVSNLLLSGNTQPTVSSETIRSAHLLTPTEKIILKEIALGKTTKEIASDKNLSFHTINSHRKNIFRKLGVNNVHEATKYAMRAGIVDLAEYYI
ncbi:response regulator transcription factor [Oscillospiraceae bacterium N12]|jgi:DNA-binding NarL/FixJ family response regulator|uniref:Response regulator transcription factor n=1 Tax=Jilunia laotingensis TaxID=2763675 RepID=A0A926F6G3_9BACT|nr:response regulator transcription factor [Jilunia laotingensis]MBC8595103.1 response regulator transcription factor [Jilunia laotingensis]